MGLQPMNHRQDADATKPHGQDARATSVRNGYMQLSWALAPMLRATGGKTGICGCLADLNPYNRH